MFHKDNFVMFVLYLCQQGCHRQIDGQALCGDTFLTVLRNISNIQNKSFYTLIVIFYMHFSYQVRTFFFLGGGAFSKVSSYF